MTKNGVRNSLGAGSHRVTQVSTTNYSNRLNGNVCSSRLSHPLSLIKWRLPVRVYQKLCMCMYARACVCVCVCMWLTLTFICVSFVWRAAELLCVSILLVVPLFVCKCIWCAGGVCYSVYVCVCVRVYVCCQRQRFCLLPSSFFQLIVRMMWLTFA